MQRNAVTIQIQTEPPGTPLTVRPHPFWGRAFRPFFLGVGVFGFVFVLAWTAIWRGALGAPTWLPLPWWHAHEMLFGLVVAAISGFALTAVAVWTGRPALCGRPLAMLFSVWVLGRLAMASAGHLPAALVAAVDLAFLPLVLASFLHSLWGTGQWRNYGVAALLAALALANAAVHAQALGLTAASAPRALRFGVDLVIALIVVIGGRITPGFTTNALLRAGIQARATSRPRLDKLAVALVVTLAAADLFVPRSAVTGVAAAAAALAVAARMSGWQTLRTLRDPLVWSLHAGMAWVVIGLLLVAASDLGAAVAPAAGLHALTAGAMGTMILAVVTRVSLGHTGRPLVLPRGAVAIYGLVQAGAILRVLSALALSSDPLTLLLVAGVLWASAFGLFAVLYARILVGPRVDGNPG